MQYGIPDFLLNANHNLNHWIVLFWMVWIANDLLARIVICTRPSPGSRILCKMPTIILADELYFEWSRFMDDLLFSRIDRPQIRTIQNLSILANRSFANPDHSKYIYLLWLNLMFVYTPEVITKEQTNGFLFSLPIPQPPHPLPGKMDFKNRRDYFQPFQHI